MLGAHRTVAPEKVVDAHDAGVIGKPARDVVKFTLGEQGASWGAGSRGLG